MMTIPFSGWTYPYEERTVSVDGHRLSYMDEGVGKPLVWIHPIATGGFFWTLNAPAFQDSYRLIIPDVLGHGRSDKPDTPYTMARLADQICQLLDHLGIESAIWIGNSMGGQISLEAALSRPDMVERLIIEDGAGAQLLPDPPLTWTLKRLEPLITTRSGRFPIPKPLIDVGVRWIFERQPPQVRALVDYYHRVLQDDEADRRARAVVRILQDVVASSPRKRLYRIEAPALIIWGDRDRLLPMRSGRFMRNALPRATLTLFHRTGHCPHVERPAAWNHLVDRWLRRGTAPGIV